jgi:hypothetical protein
LALAELAPELSKKPAKCLGFDITHVGLSDGSVRRAYLRFESTVPHKLPDRLRYLEPVRKQLAALNPDDIDESTDLSVLRRVVRKHLKGLPDQDARLALREDAAELERWLSTPGLQDTRLYFVVPILPDAIDVLLTERPPSRPERGEAKMDMADGAKVTVENGCWSVKWRRFYLSLYPSHLEDIHREAGQFRDDARSHPMIDGNGMSIGEVRFGEVTGIKRVSKIASPPMFKRVDYALDVPGGHIVAVLDSSRGDFDESEVERYFHTLRVLNYPAPTSEQATARTTHPRDNQ